MFFFLLPFALAIVVFVYDSWRQRQVKLPADDYDATKYDLDAADKRYQRALGKATGKTYLVVGAGNLGSEIIHALIRRGEKHIRAFDVNIHPDLKKLPEVTTFRGDICKDHKLLEMALENVDVVFHTAAMIAFSQDLQFQYEAVHKVNVTAVATVIEFCRKLNVSIFVYTSSGHVFEPGLAVRDDSPFAIVPNNHYVTTKILGEKLALASNSTAGSGLRTISVRPNGGIMGHMNKATLQQAIDSLSSGFRMYINPDFSSDFVCVRNCVYAHLLAADKLCEGGEVSDRIAGKGFLIGNDWHESIVAMDATLLKFIPNAQNVKLIYRPLFISWLAHAVRMVSYLSGGKLPPPGSDIAMLTPATMRTVGRDFRTKDSMARLPTTLGYTPIYSREECLKRCMVELGMYDDVNECVIPPEKSKTQ
eukprot:GFYU01006636.1.p1 GENE.GFYU01006636.1~~GFYU01006636.1.p1  ORF type:complete len:420 (-),score=93.14 GFYU01006636.1:1008-2267(-)